MARWPRSISDRCESAMLKQHLDFMLYLPMRGNGEWAAPTENGHHPPFLLGNGGPAIFIHQDRLPDHRQSRSSLREGRSNSAVPEVLRFFPLLGVDRRADQLRMRLAIAMHALKVSTPYGGSRLLDWLHEAGDARLRRMWDKDAATMTRHCPYAPTTQEMNDFAFRDSATVRSGKSGA